MNKESLYSFIESLKPELCALSDDIFDHPEVGLEEVYASGLIED